MKKGRDSRQWGRGAVRSCVERFVVLLTFAAIVPQIAG